MVSTRSGHHWVIEDNTIRYANTIGLDIGSEWGIRGTAEDAPLPPGAAPGYHVVRKNVIPDNGLCGIAGPGHFRVEQGAGLYLLAAAGSGILRGSSVVNNYRPAHSGGSPRQLTGEGGFDAREPADGRTVYFTEGRTRPGLWCVPVSGGMWTPGAAGIHWMDRLTDASYALMLWRPAKESSEPVLRVEAPIWSVASVLPVTAEGRRACWRQNDDSGAGLVLPENFR